MERARNIMLAAGFAMLVALAGCSTTRNTPANSGSTSASSGNTLADSATALERNARALADQSDQMTPVLQQDAHRLADSAFQFHSYVGVSGTDNASARSAFESVSRNYQRVSQDVNEAGTANARADLQPVTQAYQEVERALR